ncbi:MAG: tetratricopeptide repeat protein, partial [Nitrospira sp.]|nr:tetratricopeptide repeat protein [Nitrospira sp.]
MLLTLIGLGIEPSDATLPEPLLNQGTLPPEEADGPFRYWSRHEKYFLVIAVNQTDVPKTDLPFAQVDGQRVVTALTGLGYQPVDPAHPMLTGEAATRTAIVASIKNARARNEEATFVVYYTGHGAVGAKDLWLQTAGQDEVGDGQGVAVSDLIGLIRRTEAGKAFEGELVLILDACYSGRGTLSQGLTLGEAGKRTTILTSSSDIQASFILNPPHVPKPMSAFTYSFLQAAGPEWTQADSDHDGMLRWDEVRLYARKQLREFKNRGAVMSLMEPYMSSNYTDGFLAYRRDQVRVWNSSYREELTVSMTESHLAAPLQKLESNPANLLKWPNDARLLANTLEPASNDYFAQAVKAMAEGQLVNARVELAKAEKQFQERAAQAETIKRQEIKNAAQIVLALARLESYAGEFTEAFHQYQRMARISPPSTLELVNEMGLAAFRARRFQDAQTYLEQALRKAEQTGASGHPDIATTTNNLALVYGAQGNYAKAEKLLERVRQIDKETLGPTHANLAASLNNLAFIYSVQRKYIDAEPLYQRAIQIHEAALGSNNLYVARDLNNLASMYRAQKRNTEAETLLRRAIKIGEAAHGPGYPDLANFLDGLAELYNDLKRYADSEPLYRRAIQIYEAALGPNHPQVGRGLNNLANLHREQKEKYAESETLFKRSIQIARTALGPKSSELAIVLNNLALLYDAQRYYANAEPLYQESIWILHRSGD